MNINITKKEYVTLLEIFEIADWILHAHRTDLPADRKKHRDLRKKVLSLAGDFGCEHLVENVGGREGYSPTVEFEESSPWMEFVSEHLDDSFWEDAIDRFAGRDLIREIGEDAYLAMDGFERLERIIPYEEKYGEEFEKHGLDRMEIVAEASGASRG